MYNISDVTLQINERFFAAVASLKKQRLLGGLKGFSERYNVVLGNLYTIKTRKRGAVKAEYLHFLVVDYGLSAEWLLTGKGGMFIQMSAKTE